MSQVQNNPSSVLGRRTREINALELGPRKKLCVYIPVIQLIAYRIIRCISDPFVHRGRHFGRTVHAMCSVGALITNGLIRLGDLSDEPEESFTAEYVLLYAFFPVTNLYPSFL